MSRMSAKDSTQAALSLKIVECGERVVEIDKPTLGVSEMNTASVMLARAASNFAWLFRAMLLRPLLPASDVVAHGEHPDHIPTLIANCPVRPGDPYSLTIFALTFSLTFVA